MIFSRQMPLDAPSADASQNYLPLHFCRNFRLVTGSSIVKSHTEMVQALSRSLGASRCFNCRLSLLRAFTAVSSTPLHHRYSRTASPRLSNHEQTRFSSSSHQIDTVTSGVSRDGA